MFNEESTVTLIPVPETHTEFSSVVIRYPFAQVIRLRFIGESLIVRKNGRRNHVYVEIHINFGRRESFLLILITRKNRTNVCVHQTIAKKKNRPQQEMICCVPKLSADSPTNCIVSHSDKRHDHLFSAIKIIWNGFLLCNKVELHTIGSAPLNARRLSLSVYRFNVIEYTPGHTRVGWGLKMSE